MSRKFIKNELQIRLKEKIHISNGEEFVQYLPTELPAEIKDTFYIVSLPVALYYKASKNNLYVPYDYIRNEKGQIIGCKKLIKVWGY